MSIRPNGDWYCRLTDMSVRFMFVSWMVFDGDRCLHSLGCFRSREAAIEAAQKYARKMEAVNQ